MGSFHLLATVNGAAMNVAVKVFVGSSSDLVSHYFILHLAKINFWKINLIFSSLS